MHGTNTQEAHGLDGFLRLLDERADVDKRQRGLVTGKQALKAILEILKSYNLSSQFQTTFACTSVSHLIYCCKESTFANTSDNLD